MKKTILLWISICAHIMADVTDVETLSQTLSAVNSTVDSLDKISGGVFSNMNHGEVEYAHGMIAVSGGFLGLEGEIRDKVTTYTLKNEHGNLFVDHIYYAYKVSWYDSEKLTQKQSLYNESSEALIIPPIDYHIRGLDADFGLGWNIIDNGENDYWGVGITTGISLPIIKASELPAVVETDDTTEIGEITSKGKTTIETYKIGGHMKLAKSLNDSMWVYGSVSYAYQKASIINKSIGIPSTISGHFIENELGVAYRPINKSYSITDWLTLTPRLYFTCGVRYSTWVHHKSSINLFDQSLVVKNPDLKVTAKTNYIGIGYSF